jgi:hypothetical protein
MSILRHFLNEDQQAAYDKFEDLIDEYQHAQLHGTSRERVEARRALKVAFMEALIKQDTKPEQP